jgi:hypothetical protein
LGIKGNQDTSSSVPGFPSVKAAWMPVIGCQWLKAYLASQATIAASARPIPRSAQSRVRSRVDSPRAIATSMAIRNQCLGGVSVPALLAQNNAIWVCSSMCNVLVFLQRFLTLLKAIVYSSLVSAGKTAGRRDKPLLKVNGFTRGKLGRSGGLNTGSVEIQKPGNWLVGWGGDSSTELLFERIASTSFAQTVPHFLPLVSGLVGMPASEVMSWASNSSTWVGKSATSTLCAAVMAAATVEALNFGLLMTW